MFVYCQYNHFKLNNIYFAAVALSAGWFLRFSIPGIVAVKALVSLYDFDLKHFLSLENGGY